MYRNIQTQIKVRNKPVMYIGSCCNKTKKECITFSNIIHNLYFRVLYPVARNIKLSLNLLLIDLI
jgi:hypothetical protein